MQRCFSPISSDPEGNMFERLLEIEKRYVSVAEELASPGVYGDPQRAAELVCSNCSRSSRLMSVLSSPPRSRA